LGDTYLVTSTTSALQVAVFVTVTLNPDNIFVNLSYSAGVPRGYKGHKLFWGMGNDDHSSDGSG